MAATPRCQALWHLQEVASASTNGSAHRFHTVSFWIQTSSPLAPEGCVSYRGVQREQRVVIGCVQGIYRLLQILQRMQPFSPPSYRTVLCSRRVYVISGKTTKVVNQNVPPHPAITQSKAVIYTQESTHKVLKPASKGALRNTQLFSPATRPTPHVVSRSVRAMSAWLRKIPRASYGRCRDSRVFVFRTTTMNDIECSPLPDITQGILCSCSNTNFWIHRL